MSLAGDHFIINWPGHEDLDHLSVALCSVTNLQTYTMPNIVFDGNGAGPLTQDMGHCCRSRGLVGTAVINTLLACPFPSIKTFTVVNNVSKDSYYADRLHSEHSY